MHHNDTVKVKLTEDGLRFLRSRYMLLKSYYPNTSNKFEDVYIIDSDNYWRTQLWNVVETLGYDESSHLTKPKFTSIEKIIEGHILQRFAKLLNDKKVLTHPKDFLGPNTDKVLDFWMILDELTQEQRKTIHRRYWGFYFDQWSEWDKVTDEAIKASEETIGREFAINSAWAACDVSGLAADRATREIIGGIKNPVFVPMFNNL